MEARSRERVADRGVRPQDAAGSWKRPRGWAWRAFRSRSDPGDASDFDCRHRDVDDPALRYYCAKLAHYEFQRDWNRGLFRFWQTVAIVATATVPVLAAAGVAERWVDAVPAAIAGIALAVIALFGWQNDYVHFTRVVEGLLAERLLFKKNAGPYAANHDETDDERFASRIAEIVDAEIKAWTPPQPSQPSSHRPS
jgi:hypothetical protein